MSSSNGSQGVRHDRVSMTDDLLMGKVMSNSHCRIDAQLSNMCLIDCISKQNFLCKIDFLPEYTDFLLVFSRIFQY
ncbi:hypothetical protein DW724_03285 [Butyricicoccus sp. AM27-36]|nr:hypothetical protein DW724_03285 [Butyricicoccus sp. AM27-36]